MRSSTPRLPLTVVVALLALGQAPAALLGWSPETQRALAADAARIAPPDLARQLDRYSHELASGAVEPFRDRDGTRHVKNEDGSGALDRAIAEETAAAVAALKAFRPFAEIARRLGRVSHWAADLNNPLNSSSADAVESRYFRDFLVYAESARPRFAVVLYENRAALARAADVERLSHDALARSRRLYPMIGLEYRRIDFGSGRASFDDRSTAFGVAALSYSHAVTDAALLFRYVWLEAGGVDSRSILDRPRDRLLLLGTLAP